MTFSVIGPSNRIRLLSHDGFMLSYGGLAFAFGHQANVLKTGPSLSRAIPVAFSDSYVFGALGGNPRFAMITEPGFTYSVFANVRGVEVSRSLVPEPGFLPLALGGLGALALSAQARVRIHASKARAKRSGAPGTTRR